ncbi:hypothetical protein GCM10022261_09420 [Brevibacterium daeguense]|uniref:Class I SAM-dependent methyltransferase n=1 Tax=Brevibacterium daeguense TaxID=909936 RepID=A0ABP8EHQ4_9MICO|nr:class I SAM-dependent methyltransferase [Brevibacterium daeguense]
MTAAAHDWLDMRLPVDDEARRHALPLLDKAAARLIGPVTVIDIGAGTGNSALWFDRHLRPRLDGREINWVLLDADADSLGVASRALPEATTVTAPITSLPDVAAEHLRGESASGHLLVTCSAVCDVLTPADVDVVAQTLHRFGGMGLFLLSITDEWSLSPVDPRDEAIGSAFAAHQQREGRLGAEGGAAMAAAGRRIGAEVTSSASPWQLDAPDDSEFISRFLMERVEAAVEEAPGLRDAADEWLSVRLEQAKVDLSVVVDHLDVFIDAGRRG